MLLNVFCSPEQNVCGPAQNPPPQDAINIEWIAWPAPHIITTKVNALNLISVLIIFNGVVLQVKGGRNVEEQQQV